MSHELIRFNVEKTLDTQGCTQEYRQVEVTPLSWTFVPKQDSRDTSFIVTPGNPIKVGYTKSPPRCGIKNKYDVYDYRGPISINTKRTLETNGEWSVGVNQILLTSNGKLGVPSPDFMKKWLPSELEKTQQGMVKYGSRPWITKHSVNNMIYTLKWKKHKEKQILRSASEKKIRINNAEELTEKVNKDSWKVQIEGLNPNGQKVKGKIIINRGAEYQEIADFISGKSMVLAEIPVTRDIVTVLRTTADEDHVTRVIEKMYEACNEIVWIVTGEDDEMWFKDQLEKYTEDFKFVQGWRIE